MSVAVHVHREGGRGRVAPAGAFDLAHALEAAQALDDAGPRLDGCRSVDIDLAQLDGLDGTGAVLLARFLDQLEVDGRGPRVIEGANPEAARLIALYRSTRTHPPAAHAASASPLARVGALGVQIAGTVNAALDFIGRCAVALPKAAAAPRTVDWRSMPRLLQDIGADGLPVTSAANLLVGLIIGFLGVSQLGRFGATAYVPELVVVAQFRELGPLVTAIVVAGRSGAGLASEIATMKVSEEIDALRSLGFDPVRWLVLPRCLALAIAVPMLAWIGNLLALVGGMVATVGLTDMTPRAYILATENAITAGHFLTGLSKTPFLALAIGLIACGQGLATRGGAAAVGARTTTAVVMAIFGVIVISAVFTFFYALVGV
jgi:phospholipid/cholesterol/gamma-HCH transport system permease protein